MSAAVTRNMHVGSVGMLRGGNGGVRPGVFTDTHSIEHSLEMGSRGGPVQ